VTRILVIWITCGNVPHASVDGQHEKHVVGHMVDMVPRIACMKKNPGIYREHESFIGSVRLQAYLACLMEHPEENLGWEEPQDSVSPAPHCVLW
jgi:hypothetical protein